MPFRTLLLTKQNRIGWDITKSAYSGHSFYFGTQTSAPYGLHFSEDGLRMYLCGGASVWQYTLSVPWVISSATYASKTISVGDANNNFCLGVFLNPTGTRLFVCTWGFNGSTYTSFGVVWQYSLSTAWDLATASYSAAYTLNAGSYIPYDLHFSSDGLSLYVVGATYNRVVKHTLSTAWDISTASYTAGSFIALPSPIVNPGSLHFSPDRSKCYITNTQSNLVYECALSTPGDITTLTYTSRSFDVTSQTTSNTFSAKLTADGTRMITLSATNFYGFSYELA